MPLTYNYGKSQFIKAKRIPWTIIILWYTLEELTSHIEKEILD